MSSKQKSQKKLKKSRFNYPVTWKSKNNVNSKKKEENNGATVNGKRKKFKKWNAI